MLTHDELQRAFDDGSPVIWKGQKVIVAAFEAEQVADGDVKSPPQVTSVTVRLNGKDFQVMPAELGLEH